MKKIIVIFFIFSLVISLNATNYSILKNKLCSVEYDKITGGYYIFLQGKPLFPNRYPATHFIFIKIDKKNTVLPYDYIIKDVKYNDSSIITEFELNNIYIKQVLKIIGTSSIAVEYDIKNNEIFSHKMECISVFNIASVIKRYDIVGNSVKLEMDKSPFLIFFKMSEFFLPKVIVGNYRDFKKFHWQVNKNNIKNSVALFIVTKYLKYNEKLKFVLTIGTELWDTEESNIDITSDDLDIFDK